MNSETSMEFMIPNEFRNHESPRLHGLKEVAPKGFGPTGGLSGGLWENVPDGELERDVTRAEASLGA